MAENKLGEPWRSVIETIADDTRPLTERIDDARSILSVLSALTDDPLVRAAYDNTMKLITYINDARYDAELKAASPINAAITLRETHNG